MKDNKRFPIVHTIAVLLVAVSSALWLAPATHAQTAVLTSTTDSGDAVSPGDIIEVGYEVSINDTTGSPTATTVTVTGAVGQIIVACPKGGSQTLTVNLAAQSYAIPANTTTWASSDSVYLGEATAPSNLCGGQQGTESSATFTANYGFSCQKNSDEFGCCHNICFRFHHRHHHQGREFIGPFCERICKPFKMCVTPFMRGPCCEKQGHCQGM